MDPRDTDPAGLVERALALRQLSLVVGTALRRGGRVPLRQHTLFFIPMQAWGPILVALGAGVYVTRTFEVVF